MDASFGFGIALHADGLPWTLACAGVGGSALSADRQSAQMADAPITFDGLKPLQVDADFASQVAFDDVFAVLDGVDNLGELRLGQVFRPDIGADLGLFEDDLGIGGADAIDVAQRDVDAFLGRNFNADDTCHSRLTLSLFMPGIRADDTNDAFASDHFAIFAKLFH